MGAAEIRAYGDGRLGLLPTPGAWLVLTRLTDETASMRPGPARGTSVTDTFVVTHEMTARVDGREIHPVYGTGALVADIERLCRQVLEPHLEPGEEGVGGRLEVLHRAPVAVGETVALEAIVATVGPTSLVCEIIARHNNTIVARGSFEQRLVTLERFRDETEARRAPSPANDAS